MNPTHVHLLITHLPIYGSILGTIVLLYGLFTQSRHTQIAAYLVFIISVIGGIIAFSTGEAAEETAKNIQGISKQIIEEHEEFAKVTLAALIAFGLLSVSGLWLTWKNFKLSKAISVIVLLVSLACIGMTSWTGYLGGKIRHTEIGQEPLKINPADSKHDDN